MTVSLLTTTKQHQVLLSAAFHPACFSTCRITEFAVVIREKFLLLILKALQARVLLPPSTGSFGNYTYSRQGIMKLRIIIPFDYFALLALAYYIDLL